MKSKAFFLLVFTSIFAANIYAENTRILPAPQKKGGMPLMQALNERSTKRTYSSKELSDQQISDLLWCANGVNRANGRRTAPSAINRQEIELYLLTSQGVFKYDAVKNALTEINRNDFRKWAGNFTAPVYIAIVADMKKAASDHYAKIDSGYVSQNIYLYCASAGLGTCAIGSFDRIKDSGKGKKLRDALKLEDKQTVLLTHSVGFPEVR